jgi:chromosome segregation ATPase
MCLTMYLKRLEIQGFKTFAQKTVVEFPEKKKNSNPLTVIVGPNGSGKSNIADAIRWCLGEQSMKQLRGKKTEDIIFSGSEGRSRSGFAEVTMIFENEDKALKTDFAEVAITRRLYRDGESDYMLNGQSARLQDIQLLLAEAGVGQRSYAVIGQGMIDHVLVSSPEERKLFFDDATGVRGLQIRRHQSLLKLEKSAVNLAEVQMLLDELEPRLNMLKRQVRRLEEREKVTAELKTVSLEYFQGKWAELEVEKKAIAVKLQGMDAKVDAKRAELAAGDKKLAEFEVQEVGKGDQASGMGELQAAYKKAQGNLAEARKAQVMAEREIELAKVRAQSSWSPLPLQDIVSEVKFIAESHSSLLDKLKAVKTVEEIRLLEKEVEESLSRSKKLRDRLVKPNPEDFKADPDAVAAVEKAHTAIVLAESDVKKTEAAMDAKAREASAAKSEIFAFQRTLRTLQTELMALEQARNASQIEMARVETRQDALKQEAREGMGVEVDFSHYTPHPTAYSLNDLYEKMMKLRRQVEMIGGIEESVVKEHSEVSERFTFLSTQVVDLRAAIASTEKIVDELDKEIHGQSERALKEINHEFQKYFKILFGGGSCSLMKVEIDNADPDAAGAAPGPDASLLLSKEESEEVMSSDLVTSRVKARREAIIGIDIQATPPGKRLKALNLLSGGERALTSIALLCAIMATNPSPFVVLDEVDAALDEANTVRFANILNELRERTQFIVVTHNRATMEKGDTLYGVSMGGDGVSKLLSVKIEDVVTDGARR